MHPLLSSVDSRRLPKSYDDTLSIEDISAGYFCCDDRRVDSQCYRYHHLLITYISCSWHSFFTNRHPGGLVADIGGQSSCCCRTSHSRCPPNQLLHAFTLVGDPASSGPCIASRVITRDSILLQDPFLLLLLLLFIHACSPSGYDGKITSYRVSLCRYLHFQAGKGLSSLHPVTGRKREFW